VKKGRKRKLTAPDGPKKPTIISSNSPKKSSSPAKKKGKKRNPWSDSEGSDAAGSDRSDVDMDTSFANVVEREKAPRRAAGYIFHFVSNYHDYQYLIAILFDAGYSYICFNIRVNLGCDRHNCFLLLFTLGRYGIVGFKVPLDTS